MEKYVNGNDVHVMVSTDDFECGMFGSISKDEIYTHIHKTQIHQHVMSSLTPPPVHPR